jgi:hypothetical protein
MICDKYRGKNTGLQCVKIAGVFGLEIIILVQSAKITILEFSFGFW